MPITEAAGTAKLVVLAITMALALSAIGCATGPLGSHGVDTVPAFVNPNEGMGR